MRLLRLAPLPCGVTKTMLNMFFSEVKLAGELWFANKKQRHGSTESERERKKRKLNSIETRLYR